MSHSNFQVYRDALSGFCLQHDRGSLQRKSADYIQQQHSKSAHCLLLYQGKLVVPTPQSYSLPLHQALTYDRTLEQPIWLGLYQQIPYFAIELCDLPACYDQLLDLRYDTLTLPCEYLSMAALAKVLLYWHQQTPYCNRCGHICHSDHSGYERHCSNNECQHIQYPAMPPAIISVVSYQDQCLLGRQASWPDKRYSNIAGFVDPLESAEMAVHREVYEEAGIQLSKVHYQYSQCWPFPGSLMLGFHAEAATTDIKCHDGELCDARWFSVMQLANAIQSKQVTLPNPISISYQLLNDWFCQYSDQSLIDLVDS